MPTSAIKPAPLMKPKMAPIRPAAFIMRSTSLSSITIYPKNFAKRIVQNLFYVLFSHVFFPLVFDLVDNKANNRVCFFDNLSGIFSTYPFAQGHSLDR